MLAAGDVGGAEAMFRSSLEAHRRAEGATHPATLRALGSVALVLEVQGRLAEAQERYEEAVRLGTESQGAMHPDVLGYTLGLGRVRVARGQAVAAEPALRAVLAERLRLYPRGEYRVGVAQAALGWALLEQRRYAEAEPLLTAAVQTLRPIVGPEGREREAARARLATLYRATGRATEFASLR
jgi:tetratricopeptide (TPR) repeat protein